MDAINLDRDGDGFLRPSDCNDSDARVHPGAVDIAGNAIDEDCRDGAAPFPLLDSTVAATFSFGRRFTLFTTVTIRRVHAGSTLRLTCNGSGCPFRSRTQKLKRDRRKLTLARPLAPRETPTRRAVRGPDHPTRRGRHDRPLHRTRGQAPGPQRPLPPARHLTPDTVPLVPTWQRPLNATGLTASEPALSRH